MIQILGYNFKTICRKLFFVFENKFICNHKISYNGLFKGNCRFPSSRCSPAIQIKKRSHYNPIKSIPSGGKFAKLMQTR